LASSEGESGQAGNEGQREKEGKGADDPSDRAHSSLPAEAAVRSLAPAFLILQPSQLGRRTFHSGRHSKARVPVSKLLKNSLSTRLL
jgi:hypothetical protein